MRKKEIKRKIINTPVKRSAKTVREDFEDRKLRAISKRVDIFKLITDHEPLHVEHLEM